MMDVKQLTNEYLTGLENVNLVLDLGCGEGKKSLRFAREGIKVTGIDTKNMEIIQENFEFIQKNVLEFEFPKEYNLIIISLVLHFFRKEKAVEIIKKIQKSTADRGYNFFICMSNLNDLSKEKENNFYPRLEELKQLYLKEEWEIVKSEQDYTDYGTHGDLSPHRHNIIFFLTKKISQT